MRSPTQCPVLLLRLLPQWLLWLPLPSPTGVPLSMPLPSVVGLRLLLAGPALSLLFPTCLTREEIVFLAKCFNGDRR